MLKNKTKQIPMAMNFWAVGPPMVVPVVRRGECCPVHVGHGVTCRAGGAGGQEGERCKQRKRDNERDT